MKRKLQLKKLGVLLTTVFISGTFLWGCGSSSTSKEEDKSESVNVDTEEFAKYTFGHNNWGQGAYPLDIIEKEAKNQAELFGNELLVVNDEFKADKVISDVQSLISSGVDGIQFFGISETMFTSVSKICADTKVPFVLFDKIPSDEVMEKLKENPYFVGAISAEDKSAGKAMAEAALKDGGKKAIIVAAAKGDSSHDLRIEGFTETFIEGGGTVLGVAHSADPTEAVQKANDLITAYPDADVIYGSGGDYVLGTLNALASRKDSNVKTKIYATDIAPDIASKLKSGEISALSGGHWVAGAIANTLLINYLDGHPILDEDGKAPVLTNLQMCTLSSDQVDAFNKLLESNGSPISNDEYKSLTFRYNPDVNYQTYYDFMSNYSNIFKAKLN